MKRARPRLLVAIYDMLRISRDYDKERAASLFGRVSRLERRLEQGPAYKALDISTLSSYFTSYDVDELVWNGQSARGLLMAIIRRAAFDWVLYKKTTRMPEQEYASSAETWLFHEQPGHPDWEARTQPEDRFMSFLSICEALDLDPRQVRSSIRSLTRKRIMSLGRPPDNAPFRGYEEAPLPSGHAFESVFELAASSENNY